MSEIQLIQQAEQLFSAASEGNLARVTKLVEKGAGVNVQDADGHAPLHFAAYNGRTEAVKALIAKGADVNIKSNNGHAPLHWAVNDGRTEGVLALLAEGADVNVKDADGRTPLHLAAQDGYTETVECLINHIAKLVAAGLYVSQENLECTSDFISSTQERRNDYSQHLQQYKEEIVKLIKENKPLHDFLKESNINKLVSIWEKNEDIHSQFDDQKSLKEQYPEYAHILINKANEVKKVIFLHNHKPLTDVLSQHYNCDFKTMTFTGIRTLFDVRRNDFREKLESGGISLINFVEADFVAQKYVPTLKVQAFAKVINTVLDNPNFGQIQGQAASRS